MLRRFRRDETGAALITVLILSTLSIIAVTTAVSYSTNSLPRTRAHEDWNAALAAAEAGVADVQARLNDDPSFYIHPPTSNPAMMGWRALPGSTSDARYHYRIDNAEVFRSGTLQVTSTGRVGDQERTIRAALRRRGFLDFIYFTDLEKVDPYTVPGLSDNERTRRNTACAVHQPAGSNNTRAVDNGNCNIQFADFDVIDGPMHTNDAIMLNTGTGGKPQFLGPVTTAWAGFGSGPQFWIRTGGSGSPLFREGIRRGDYLPVPETGSEVKEAARAEGCVYRGPTYIRFHVDAGTPRMTVVSPLTPNGTAGAGCGPGRVDLPNGRVIYVERHTGGGVGAHPLGMNRGDVTVTEGQTETRWRYGTDFSPTAGDVFVHGQVNGLLTVAAENDINIVHNMTYTSGKSLDGDDMIGLVADNRVAIYHPVATREQRSCSTWWLSRCWSWGSWSTIGVQNAPAIGRDLPPFASAGTLRDTSLPAGSGEVWQNATVHAAILALNRSFHVQNYNTGARLGTLEVFGAIAQRWRGPVATTGGTGYDKQYEYDWRLRNVSPPHFPVPEGSRWGPRTWAELDNPPACTGTQAPPAVACLPN